MKTEGVVAHVNYLVLNSGDNNHDDEVQKIGQIYGTDLCICQIKKLLQQGYPREPTLLGVQVNESAEEQKIQKNLNKKKNCHSKKLVMKLNRAQCEVVFLFV